MLLDVYDNEKQLGIMLNLYNLILMLHFATLSKDANFFQDIESIVLKPTPCVSMHLLTTHHQQPYRKLPLPTHSTNPAPDSNVLS